MQGSASALLRVLQQASATSDQAIPNNAGYSQQPRLVKVTGSVTREGGLQGSRGLCNCTPSSKERSTYLLKTCLAIETKVRVVKSHDHKLYQQPPSTSNQVHRNGRLVKLPLLICGV